MNRRWIFLPAVVTGWVLLVSSPQTSAGLVATYQFQDTLAADEAGAPALTALNSGAFVTATNVLGQTRTVYERTSTNPSHDTQSALTVSVAALGLTSNDYSVELVYDFTNGYSGPDFRRVVNANGGDPGLYVSSRTGPGNLQIDDWLGYSHTGGPPLADGTFYHLILSVTPTGEQVYINGVLALNLVGLTPNAITAANLTFFQDNAGEYGNGSVALLRIYDSALNASQVSAAWNNGDPFAAAAVPEPASLSLAAVGGLVVLVLARGRRGLG